MNIGDKVKLIKVQGHYGALNKYIGQIGFVIKEDDSGCDVEFQNNKQQKFYCYRSELELVNESNT